MSREWKPGELAMWEHGGRNDGRELVMKTNRGWAAFDGPTSEILFGTVRPLVVIDPEDREAVERLAIAYTLRHNYAGKPWEDREQRNRDFVIDSLADALREFADPKPPRPEEPTDVGCVVEDSDGRFWTKATLASAAPWGEVGDLRWRAWDDIDVVRVVVGP